MGQYLLEKEFVVMEEEFLGKSKYKLFLLFTKYTPHLICLAYIIYTILGFIGIESIAIGYLFSITLFPWLYMFLTSLVFKFCYVHRLPLYYILVNEIITTTDYYLNIPVSDLTLLGIHLIIIGVLIMGYTNYYLYKKKHAEDN